ncbi:hypothetical protein HU200_029151 [Digitaria exilis]|uniref:Dirigent protein n=1 Tax=Digitaria exilis TaxID=1010633 RepID=A0A835BTW1_9POAL|nr:hypothetical protein HU200_029151 [Digitaria exilis]CAB3489320.1 unnamed protein product [Digitaria exilis]
MTNSSSRFIALTGLLTAATGLLLAATSPATAEPWDQKETRLRVYWHDVLSGNNATAVTVAEGPLTNTSATQFGKVIVIDDALTLEPNLTTSKIIGHAEGIYVSAGKDTLSLMMAMNFVFIDGPYNGSSIAIFGPNFAERKVREMSVIGGTGVFRFARGYVEIMTWSNTVDTTVQYDIFVRHDD